MKDARFVVPPTGQGERLDRFLALALEELGYHDLSREKIKARIRLGLARVDDVPRTSPSARLAGGERIVFTLPEHSPSQLEAEAGELRLLHSDQRLAVLDKPAGLTVHPADSQPTGTLVHRLLHHFPALAEMEGLRPGIVHRIDKDTSGLLLVALDEATRLTLSQAFARRAVDKRYLALVHGVPETGPDGFAHFDGPIGRHPKLKTRMAVLAKGGKAAHTRCRVLWTAPGGEASLLDVAIFTGRTHQIRVHLSHAGHPLLGDALYGGDRPAPPSRPLLNKLAPRQMLHAWRLGFKHPDGQRLDFLCPPPRDMLRPMLYLGRRLQRVVVTGLPGCGKSAVTNLLGQAHLPTFSADAVVAELYAPGANGWTLLRRRFGERFTPEASQPVDKRGLFQAMLQDEALRREVMELVHPLVFHRLQAFWAEQAGERAAVAEIPLILESGRRRGEDELLVGVFCPDATRHARLHIRGVPPDMAHALDSWQWPQPAKLAACQLIVDNSGSLEDLQHRRLGLTSVLREFRRKQARELWRDLLRLVSPESKETP